MPNAKILNEKKQIVEGLTEKLKSQAGVFVNYSGINVNDDTQMRVKLREANIDYTVVKNTLMKFAIKNVGFEELDPIFNGTTSLAISKDDPIAPARVIKEFADKFNGYFEIKGGFMDGKVLSVSEVNSLAGIPALPILQAQLLGTMLAPITSLAVVLKAIAEKDGAPVEAEAAAVAEEPAAAEAEAAAVAEEPAAAETEAAAVAEEPAAAETEAEPAAEEPAAVEAEAAPAAEESASAEAEVAADAEEQAT